MSAQTRQRVRIAVIGAGHQRPAAVAARRHPLDQRVDTAAAADPPRRQPPQQHVFRHDDVDDDQRTAAVHDPVERASEFHDPLLGVADRGQHGVATQECLP